MSPFPFLDYYSFIIIAESVVFLQFFIDEG